MSSPNDSVPSLSPPTSAPLPCPFCGHDAEITGVDVSATVKCGNRSGRCIGSWLFCYGPVKMQLEAWNRRAAVGDGGHTELLAEAAQMLRNLALHMAVNCKAEKPCSICAYTEQNVEKMAVRLDAALSPKKD